jgi:chromosome segregation protein
MFLKSLTLKGFKSFADPTTLTLEPGVTVVVGPNGSGKSNVVDAIAWVLGAQAPTAVRSQKMDDVIFAGTAKRPALGRAEVSLTLDNSSGILPIEFTEVTITRTLFRTGESEYAINGVPCRLLDIQELLSDSGVGRQQHVVVSQGQIDAVLNARPEDRRAIIEEAAGVLKYRKRREKSQRRLEATENNLTRISDLLREVRRQLRPLERQAEAARRYDGVVTELTALRRYVAGRELVALRRRLEANAVRKGDIATRSDELRAELARLDAEVMHAEAQLSAHGGDDVGDALVRLEALRERTRGLANVLTERLRVIERDRGAQVDRDVVANLEADAARLRADLQAVENDAEALIPEFERLNEAEIDLGSARLRFEEEWADGVAAPSGKAAEVRGEVGALRAAVERGSAERQRLEQRLASLGNDAAGIDGELERVAGELRAVEAGESPLVEALQSAEAARDRAEDAVATAQSAVSDADAEWNSWSARADALALALDEARARAGAERLADVAGVVGTLLDLVEVDEGWEAPFEAAAGEALDAVVVDSVDAARQALGTLRAGDVSGAVLALGAALPAASAPPVGEPVRRHVRARHHGVDQLLDALLGGAVVVDGDLFAGIDVVLAHPGAVVVTRDGDRLGTSGWRVGGTRAQATGAALEEARARASAAGERRAAARAALDQVSAARASAVAAVRDAGRALDEHNKRLGALTDARVRVERRRETLGTEIESLQARIAELADRLTRESARVAELDELLPVLEGEENETLARGRAMAEARAQLEERAAAVGAIRTDIEMRAAGLEDRRKFLNQRLAEIEARLERDAAQRAEAEAKRVVLEQRQAATEHLVDIVRDRLGRIETELADLRERRRRQSEAARAIAARLDAVRRDRQAAEQRLAEQRELANRAELDEAETQMRIEAAVEALRRDLDCEPDQAIAAECPPLAEGVTPPARIRELERELKLMGPINPLALEEFQALQERHDFLEQQLDDIKASRRELGKVIRSIDEEIVNVFAAAFADVANNFEKLFEMLFPGGKGSLRLTDPENLLDTGVEVEARPSGKNVRKLSLLSGGERSLTALAYLFAVFRSRPSPFYVMDEVEAALDDVNLHRFLGLVDEFRNEAQLLIVSHQKRTMEAADCLYGVTMQPGGSSKAISEKVKSASGSPSNN